MSLEVPLGADLTGLQRRLPSSSVSVSIYPPSPFPPPPAGHNGPQLLVMAGLWRGAAATLAPNCQYARPGRPCAGRGRRHTEGQPKNGMLGVRHALQLPTQRITRASEALPVLMMIGLIHHLRSRGVCGHFSALPC